MFPAEVLCRYHPLVGHLAIPRGSDTPGEGEGRVTEERRGREERGRGRGEWRDKAGMKGRLERRGKER